MVRTRLFYFFVYPVLHNKGKIRRMKNANLCCLSVDYTISYFSIHNILHKGVLLLLSYIWRIDQLGRKPGRISAG
ncbi:MAG: hypothetical protein AMJ60_04780 [Desulfobacterales bacterium SG8_35]|nr:MAG: hypothetical protein AMJ60_04780 [Desulfobacterales bacterium SG8_35]